jgi:hypothetical protein
VPLHGGPLGRADDEIRVAEGAEAALGVVSRGGPSLHEEGLDSDLPQRANDGGEGEPLGSYSRKVVTMGVAVGEGAGERGGVRDAEAAPDDRAASRAEEERPTPIEGARECVGAEVRWAGAVAPGAAEKGRDERSRLLGASERNRAPSKEGSRASAHTH